MKRLLREPLVHFLVLGTALFALHASLRPEDTRGLLGKPRLTISSGAIANLSHTFEATWQRAPSSDELEHLISDHIDEELLYRRALELGLERDDVVVRRRLRQKLESFVESVGEREPSAAELRTFFTEHAERYRREATFSFRQVYLGAGEVTDELRARADLLRDILENGGDASALAEPTGLPLENEELSLTDVARDYGEVFARNIEQLPLGRWSGPVESGFGQHVVRILTKEPGRLPEPDDVEDEVRRDFEATRSERALAKYLATERERYDVVVEATARSGTPDKRMKTASAGTPP